MPHITHIGEWTIKEFSALVKRATDAEKDGDTVEANRLLDEINAGFRRAGFFDEMEKRDQGVLGDFKFRL